jgi:hypothetical protein
MLQYNLPPGDPLHYVPRPNGICPLVDDHHFYGDVSGATRPDGSDGSVRTGSGDQQIHEVESYSKRVVEWTGLCEIWTVF